ncbi:MAG: glycosyltransferase [Armatimonadota bacterium]
MSHNPGLSIIVPVYQVNTYLRHCLDSILDQTYVNYELILVNDGSTDGCYEICEEYAQKDLRIRVIHQDNAGLSAARNCGIDLATGRYIGFVDSDDWIDADMYEMLMHDAETNNADIACCCFRRIFDNGESRSKSPDVLQETVIWENEDVFLNLYKNFNAWNKIYRADLFAEIRYPVGKIYEDARTTYRLASLAKRATWNYQQKYNYRTRPGSIMSRNNIDLALDRISIWDEIAEFMLPRFPELNDELHARKNRQIFELAESFAINGEFKAVCELRKHVTDIEYFYSVLYYDRYEWILLCKNGIVFTLAMQLKQILVKLVHALRRYI